MDWGDPNVIKHVLHVCSVSEVISFSLYEKFVDSINSLF